MARERTRDYHARPTRQRARELLPARDGGALSTARHGPPSASRARLVDPSESRREPATPDPHWARAGRPGGAAARGGGALLPHAALALAARAGVGARARARVRGELRAVGRARDRRGSLRF